MKNLQAILIGLVVFCYFAGCSENKSSTEPVDHEKSIVILYTNDEHGWMEKSDYSDGSAAMMGLWREQEGYTEGGSYLILSGGDNWTGPAISTWFKGESMVDVMNAMNYTATAIGNHEFDFKIEGFKERIVQSNYVYLSANIREKSSGNIPGYILPYLIKEVAGVKIGIIGLTTTSTPWTTFPDHVADLEFIPYDNALEAIVPQVNEEEVHLIIVIGHICRGELRALASTARELGISLMGGGHCNELFTEVVDGVVLIEGGSYMASYARVEFVLDPKTNEILEISHGVKLNQNGAEDTEVAQVVSNWQSERDAALSDVVGYAGNEISRYSAGMHNMVTDAWLYAYPTADISMTNPGGIRQSIPSGEITLATMVGVLPFENSIVELELTGTQVIDCAGDLVVGGMTTIEGYFHSDGSPLVADSIYHVLTIDYLYARTDYNFSLYDPTPYNTAIHYRQPVIDWIESLNTSSSDPLNNYLDHTPRQ